MKHSARIALAIIVMVAAFSLGFGYRYQQLQTPPDTGWHCAQLQQGQCQWQVNQQHWQLTLPDNTLSAMLAHPFEITTDSPSPPPLQLRMEGLDMYMGEIKVNLTPDENGHYAGHLLLPICNTGKMRWAGILSSLDPQQTLKLSFEVDSQ